MNRFK